jgi:hypothetical protein
MEPCPPPSSPPPPPGSSTPAACGNPFGRSAQADGAITIEATVQGKDAADRIAAELGTKPELRIHPGHRLLVSQEPQKLTHQLGESLWPRPLTERVVSCQCLTDRVPQAKSRILENSCRIPLAGRLKRIVSLMEFAWRKRDG